MKRPGSRTADDVSRSLRPGIVRYSNHGDGALFGAFFDGTNPLDCISSIGSSIQFTLGGNHYSNASLGTNDTLTFGKK
jgi:hypothetical protein